MVPAIGPLGLLCSVHPRWAEEILAGRKCVEIRRRPPSLDRPLPMLLYATRPIGAVVGHCVAEAVVRASTDRLWRVVGARSALTEDEFARYVGDAPAPGAIELAAACAITVPVPLRFRPPQSWMWLRGEEPRHLELLQAVTADS